MSDLKTRISQYQYIQMTPPFDSIPNGQSNADSAIHFSYMIT